VEAPVSPGLGRKNGPQSKLLDPLLERGAPPGREVLIPRPGAARPPAPLLYSLPSPLLPFLPLPSTPLLLLPQLWAARPSPPASWSSLLRWF
uniref:Uncharacterized protein n=1 Tax=Rhinopithecus roxellana TaxID=61622 RepID=A0A2K6NEE9_RHIRO